MAAGTELRIVGDGNSQAAERNSNGHYNQNKDNARFPAHAPIEHDGENAS